MKKQSFLLTLIILSVIFSHAQPAIEWQKSLGGTAGEWGYAIQQTHDGRFIVASSSSSNDGDVTGNHGGNDYWLIKIDGIGNLVWEKSFGGSADDKAYALTRLSSGNYLAAGSSASTNGDVTGNHGSNDYWIVRLTGQGN